VLPRKMYFPQLTHGALPVPTPLPPWQAEHFSEKMDAP